MGKPIFKVSRDVDLYMEWSSIVEAPTAIGTRAEMLDYLAKTLLSDPPEVRLARADATGTSALRDPASTYDGVLDGAWEDTGQIYKQMGFLRRNRFAAFAYCLLRNDEAAAESLLHAVAIGYNTGLLNTAACHCHHWEVEP